MSIIGDRIAAQAAARGVSISGQRAIGTAHTPPRASRNAGAFRGSLSRWLPPIAYTRIQQICERVLASDRAADLTANDWAANSGINAICTNAVGTGLVPQSRIDYRRLGITRDQAKELQNDIETVWRQWAPRAHVRGLLHFDDLQYIGLRSMLRLGELVFLPVMRPTLGTPLQLAIQDLDPGRLRTPFGRETDPHIVDGVEMDDCGVPVAYWIATPRPSAADVYDPAMLTEADFKRIPAKIGLRPGIFHLFRHNEEEQVRGETILRPGMGLFRNLSDSIDGELLAQVITSSMAMFISRPLGESIPGIVQPQDADNKPDDESDHIQEIIPGSVIYGHDGEEPHVLESSRPSANWQSFCQFVLRAMAASLDLPYEVLTKDFSQTTYSSARAALIEAWRVFMLYRHWLVEHFCTPVWGMVFEEAWLNGLVKLPAGAPDFYDAMDDYCRVQWIGPSRGYIDPVKETAANVTALQNRLMTYSEVLAERGRDFEEAMDERQEEEERLAKMPPLPTMGDTPNGVHNGNGNGAGEEDSDDKKDN